MGGMMLVFGSILPAAGLRLLELLVFLAKPSLPAWGSCRPVRTTIHLLTGLCLAGEDAREITVALNIQKQRCAMRLAASRSFHRERAL
jgi:hypothetical protein